MPANKSLSTSPASLNEQRDRLLAHVVFEAVWERDLRSDELSWEGSVEPMFGYHRDEVVNHVSWWRERVHPDDLGRVEDIVAAAVRGGAPQWSIEYRFRRKDGSWAWVASRAAIQRDADGEARRVVGAMMDITRLKDTESRLRLFTEQIPARACVTNRDLRVVWDAGTAFPDNPTVVGKTVSELFAESPDRDRVLEGCRRALAGESAKLQIDDGKSAAELQLVPCHDPAGEVIGVVGIAFDITDRVRSEEQVRAGRRLLQQVLETLPVGVLVVDRAGDVVLHNPSSASIWGETIVAGEERWSRSKGFSHATGEAIAPHQWASHRALTEGRITRDEFIDIDTFDGGHKTIRNYAAPIREPDGAITGAVIVNEDMTESVRAVESLRKTERLLVDAEALGQTGSWENDLAAGDIFATDGNLRLFFGDDAPKGARIDEYLAVIHPDDAGRVTDAREQLHAGLGSGDIEFRVVRPDGSVHWIFGRTNVVRDESGRPLRVYGTNADITARKVAEEELERRTQQLQELSARLMQSQDEERRRIARELHDTTAQNLAAIRINLSRVESSPAAASDPAFHELLAESIALTNSSIAEIRTLSYLLHPPMIEEAGLLPSLGWYAQGFQERSGIAVSLDLPDELERLPLVTETALFRIVQEALTNIQRHSESNSATIRLRRLPRSLDLEIRDCGRGVPPALRANPPMLAAAGVGMAGMRERVRELGGTMRAESDDRGTSIVVHLPMGAE
ncbi:MAG TPA: PAS domain-containing protein [Thermoanaerobaculia bacterium]|nr:PAS domain-containing protein [Thermoanaerobaculia bacterium]